MPQGDQTANRILLMGPPNVGKSALFNKLTGLEAVISNYSGTTIDYKEGFMKTSENNFHIIDVPGTYTLHATNDAEKVAVQMLDQGAELVIAVLDGNNIESSIYLLLQILQRDLPTLVVVNRVDLLADKGFEINREKLSSWLDLEVVETVAIEEKGIEKLKQKIKQAGEKDQADKFLSSKNLNADWQVAEQLTSEILLSVRSSSSSKEKSKRKIWGDRLSSPWPGLPLALVSLSLIFGVIVGLGMGLRQYIMLPFFNNWVFPLITASVETLIPSGLVRNILIGEYGFLIKGLEWPFALVFPYVISFYTGLSILEDVGYLPRLGVLIDGLFKKIGLSGGSIIPLLLGYGCAIPGIAATRALPTQKERIMVSTLICLAVPCISQTGAMISLLAEASILLVLAVFLISILVLITIGIILSNLLTGDRKSTVVEIPPLQFSGPKILGRKILIRVKTYLTHGALMMVYAIGGASVLFELGILEYLGRFLQPLVTGWLRLPAEAAIPLMLGVVRRELAVLPLLEMNLTTLQLFVGALVALFYVPCIAVLAMIAREYHLKLAVFILLFTIGFSFFAGGLAIRVGSLFPL